MTSSEFCLLMIVRDEESVITRALESMKNIITSYFIYDTGSIDNTKRIIEEWMIEHGIPGEVACAEWRNFGYNKSLLIKDAREHNNKLISEAEYYVWLDADEVWLKNSNELNSYLESMDKVKLYEELKNNPESNIFMLTTYFDSLQYRRWNLCRNNQLYKWVQPVHEYLVGEESNNTYFINWFCLLARKEGNSSKNPDRYRKDAEMFLEYLKDNPDEPRSTFYLAQTYESFDKDQSIKYYKKRIDITEGYNQERYIACLRLGRMVDDKLEKIKYFLKGTEIDDQRLECYYELMMTEYDKNQKKSAYFGLMAPLNREIKNEYLFSESNIYKYLFDINLSISCYYAGLYDIGYEFAKKVLETSVDNKFYNNLAKSNINFFIPKIQKEDKLDPPPRQELIVIENFYKDADKVRNHALSLEFPVNGNYPGKRTKPIFYYKIKEKFESIIGRPIKYWPEDSYNGSFQIVTEDGKSWIHRDATDWSAVVFLTPNPPKNGGTKIYIHKPTQKSYADTKDLEEQMNKSTYKEEDWELLDRIGNQYNRCILFRGKRCHISDRYFGKDLNDGRLFQTFFFND